MLAVWRVGACYAICPHRQSAGKVEGGTPILPYRSRHAALWGAVLHCRRLPWQCHRLKGTCLPPLPWQCRHAGRPCFRPCAVNGGGQCQANCPVAALAPSTHGRQSAPAMAGSIPRRNFLSWRVNPFCPPVKWQAASFQAFCRLPFYWHR